MRAAAPTLDDTVGSPVIEVAADSRAIVAVPGADIVLAPSVSGVGPNTHYRWMRDGREIPGTDTALLTLAELSYHDSGYYHLLVEDGGVSTRSDAIFVRVVPERTQVLAWGNNTGKQTNVPTAPGRIMAVAGGLRHSFALKSDGKVIGWGLNDYKVLDIPADLENVVSIASGQFHGVALKSDGTVVTWGRSGTQAGLSDIVAISASGSISLAVKADGTLLTWGLGSIQYAANPVPTLNGVVDAKVFDGFYSALLSDGTGRVWGSLYSNNPSIVGESNLRSLVPGSRHYLALSSEGNITPGGASSDLGPMPSAAIPAMTIACGDSLALAINEQGDIFAWGSNNFGQATVPVGSTLGFALGTGTNHALAVRDAYGDAAPVIKSQPTGTTIIEGESTSLSVEVESTSAVQYQWHLNGSALAGKTLPTLALEAVNPAQAGNYDVVVTNHIGETISTAAQLIVRPLPVILSMSPARQIVTPGSAVSLAVVATGTGGLSYQWYRNAAPISGAHTSSLHVNGSAQQLAGAYQVAITDSIGVRHAPINFVLCAPENTTLVAWGNNGWGQATVPTALGNDVIAAAAGGDHTLTLLRDGTVVAWGRQMEGQCAVPSGLSDVVAIAAGKWHSLALRSDGKVFAWGHNSYGQNTTPPELSNVIALSAGEYHNLALKSDGKVVAWGNNRDGQTTLPATLGVSVAISAGRAYSMALRADGTVSVWGSLSAGNPPPPPDLGAVTAIAGGYDHVLALKADGQIADWGSSSEITLANSRDLGPRVSIAAGRNFSLAISAEGKLTGWANFNSDIVNRANAYLRVFAVATGYDHVLALRDPSQDQLPEFSTQPTAQTAVEDTEVGFSVSTSSDTPQTYQWRKDGTPLPGAIAPTLSLRELELSDAGIYDVVVTNDLGSVTSDGAQLTIQRVSLVAQRAAARQVIVPGSAFRLEVEAQGTGNLTYQWYFNGLPVDGESRPNFSRTGAGRKHSGFYWVVVTDEVGTSRSSTFFVSVVPARTQLLGWPTSYFAVQQAPTDAQDIIAVAAGEDDSIALHRDGTVEAWGVNNQDYNSAIAALTNVVAVDAGFRFVLALHADGTVSTIRRAGFPPLPTPTGLDQVVAIAAGPSHALALRSNGTVVAWGENNYGELVVPADLSSAIRIGADNNDSYAITREGNLIRWGHGGPIENDLPESTGRLVAIDGRYFLSANGTVFSAGSGKTLVPRKPDDANIKLDDIGYGYWTSFGITDSGVTWNLTGHYPDSPTGELTGYTSCFAVDSGQSHAFVLRDATADTVPVISAAPLGVSLRELDELALSAAATSNTPLTYQWRLNGVDIPGANSPTYSIERINLDQAGIYDVVATNYLGSSTSTGANVVVRSTPKINSLSPNRILVPPGEPINLAVEAQGTGPLTYQWFHNGRAIPGAQGTSYAVAEARLADVGPYYVDVTDAMGTRRSPTIFTLWAPAKTQVKAWGKLDKGQDDIPPEFDDLIGISAGRQHGLGMRRDGTVAVWGTSSSVNFLLPPGVTDAVGVFGQLGENWVLRANGTLVSYNYPSTAPAPFEDVVEITFVDDGMCVLRNDGAVFLWDGETSQKIFEDVISISGRNGTAIGIKVDGSIAIYGSNVFGPSRIPADLANIKAFTRTNYVAAFIKSDGSILQMGLTSSVSPFVIDPVQIDSGEEHIVVRNAEGTVTAWGEYTDGKTEVPTELYDCFAISCGNKYTFALRDASRDAPPIITLQPADQTINSGASLKLSVVTRSRTPVRFQWRKNSQLLAGQTQSSLSLAAGAISLGDTFDVVVSNQQGSATSRTAKVTIAALPKIIETAPARQIIDEGTNFTLGVSVSGNGPFTYQWIHDGQPVLQAKAATLGITTATRTDVGTYWAEIGYAGGTLRSQPRFVLVAPVSTKIIGWGSNHSNQLNAISSNFDVKLMAIGDDYGLAVVGSGSAYGWGDTDEVWLHSEPSPVYHNATAFAGGKQITLALLDDASLRAWGHLLDVMLPPEGLAPVVGIAAGRNFGVALEQSGQVRAWGVNSLGQTDVPTGLGDGIAVSAGYRHAMAIRRDGRIVAWGDDQFGQSSVPKELSQVKALAAGAYHSLALKTDGTVAAWGRNDNGQCDVPSGLVNVVAIAAGREHSVALRNDGTIITWGDNTWRQTEPKPGLPRVWSIGASDTATFALLAPGEVTVVTYFSWLSDQVGSMEASYISGIDRDPTLGAPPKLLEYALDLDLNGDAYHPERIPTQSVEAGYVSLRYARRTDTVDLLYSVEVSDDLINWTSDTVFLSEVSRQPIDANHEYVTVKATRILTPGERRFLRLNIEQR